MNETKCKECGHKPLQIADVLWWMLLGVVVFGFGRYVGMQLI